MKKILTLTAGALLAGALTAGATAKRGISINSASVEEMEMLKPGVSWYYNWAPSHSLPVIPGMAFAPMCWNGVPADRVRAYCKEHPEVKWLLGFNEPNFTAQANLTPEKAAEMWPQVQALAKELNLGLVAPALNYSPNAPYQSPTKWMDEFVALVGKDAFDATAIHAYGGFGVMSDLAEQFHNRYGKPVWVTEFCFWPNEGGNVSLESQIDMMTTSVKWLEQTQWIEGYAWFMIKGKKEVNNSLLAVGGSIGNITYERTALGWLYAWLGDFDKNRCAGLDTWVNAADCNDCNNVGFARFEGIAPTENPLCVNKMVPQSWVEYNFEVPADGTYYLQASLSGRGEPERFDPQFAISVDGAEAVAAAPVTLPGSDTETAVRSWPLTLKAGKHTVRVTEQGKGSGVIFIAARLSANAAIGSIEADAAGASAEYFTLQGVRVATPAAGQIYIRRQGSEVDKVIF